MLTKFIFSLVLTISVQCKPDYEYRPDADAWFKVHKTTAQWNDAFFQCHNEGAILASPTTERMRQELKLLIEANGLHFIGTHSTFSPGHFVSIEGVPIENMPVDNMVQILHSEEGDCLATDGDYIIVASCMRRLPYVCYRNRGSGLQSVMEMTECGTFDKRYELKQSTGSCYKVHKNPRTWSDANSMCITEGGYLAVLNNEEEARIVHEMFPDMKLSAAWSMEWDPLFIGLRDWTSNGTWMSIHGEPIDQLYSDWDTNQPDNTKQYCGAIIRKGHLDNTFCHVPSFFVCEKDPKNIRFVSGKQGQFDNDQE